MPYKRRTVDCYRFYCNYGFGWEHETTEYTRKEMLVNKRAYLENSPYPLRIVRGREKIAKETNTARGHLGNNGGA